MGLAAVLVAAGARGADTWLTITGDPANSANHYIQVNAAAIDIKDDLRVIPVRINRATLWTAAGEGVQFRSVATEVQIDCTQQTARYVKPLFMPSLIFAASLSRSQATPGTTYAR
jgi:hypothetical protein